MVEMPPGPSEAPLSDSPRVPASSPASAAPVPTGSATTAELPEIELAVRTVLVHVLLLLGGAPGTPVDVEAAGVDRSAFGREIRIALRADRRIRFGCVREAASGAVPSADASGAVASYRRRRAHRCPDSRGFWARG